MVIVMLVFVDEFVMFFFVSMVVEVNLVDICMLVLDIYEDIKYVGYDNFVGCLVDGYVVLKCLLLKFVVEVLVCVEYDLCCEYVCLWIWDCYCLVCVVVDFVCWVYDLFDQIIKVMYYLKFDKLKLFGDYIVLVFGYSCGVIVDLIMEQCDVYDWYCKLLDMGMLFDWFGLCVNIDNFDVSVE